MNKMKPQISENEENLFLKQNAHVSVGTLNIWNNGSFRNRVKLQNILKHRRLNFTEFVHES